MIPYALDEKWLKIEGDKLYSNRKYSKAEKISPFGLRFQLQASLFELRRTRRPNKPGAPRGVHFPVFNGIFDLRYQELVEDPAAFWRGSKILRLRA
ncbi:MAG: hypothetical protein ISS65_07195 [Desulfobacterales bacterium]|nr:hypothetical protein [Desulfobacterales bacterium]